MTDKVGAFVDALVDAGADGFFSHDGLGYFLVPLWVVQAYAAARLERRPNLLRIVVAAHAGEAVVTAEGGNEDWLFWRIGRAWLARLGELERRVRGLPAAGVAA